MRSRNVPFVPGVERRSRNRSQMPPAAAQPPADADHWAQLGRERAEQAARIDAGLDSSLREAAAGLLDSVAEYPETLAEGWMEKYGEAAPVSAFVAYQGAFLARLREMAPVAQVEA